MGKWKKFARLLLNKKDKGPVKLSKSIKVWHRMILKANKRGLLRIKTLQDFNIRDIIGGLTEKE